MFEDLREEIVVRIVLMVLFRDFFLGCVFLLYGEVDIFFFVFLWILRRFYFSFVYFFEVMFFLFKDRCLI